MLAMLLLVLVPVTSWLNYRAGYSKANKAETNGQDPNDISTDFNGILVYINVTSFSTVTNAANLHFSFSQRIQQAGKLTPVPFTMLANSKSSSYLAADLFPEADVSFITVDATSNNYPFDTYSVSGSFLLRSGNLSLPAAVSLVSGVDSWSASTDLIDITEEGFIDTVLVYVTLRVRTWF